MSLVPASKGYPIKIVRDGTPAVINASGEPGDLYYDTIPVEQRGSWLRRKLMEEATEYLIDPSPNELADVLAVIHALAELHGLDAGRLQELVDAHPRGGFHQGIMMRGRHLEFDGDGLHGAE